MKNRSTFPQDQPVNDICRVSIRRINSSKIQYTFFLLISFLLLHGQIHAANYYSNGNQDPTLTANWWSNTNGTGTHPANFSNSDVFIIQNGHSRTASAIWTVAGSGGQILVQGGGTLTAANNVTTTQLTIDAAGTVNVNTGITLKINNGASTIDMLVLGTLKNSGIFKLTSPAKASFGNGGLYRHTRDGGTIPTATWDAGSTCEFSGILNSVPGGIPGQTFGNFTWNCAQTGNIQLNGELTAIAGSFNVSNTGLKSLILTNTASLILTLGGDFILSGGTVNFASGAAAIKTLNLGGNFIQTGGLFNNSNNIPLSFNFTGTGKTFSLSAGTLTNKNINWTINSGSSLTLLSNLPVAVSRNCTVNGTLNCSIYLLTGTGNFTLANGATLQIGSPDGITNIARTGNIQVTGTRSFSTLANYEYSAVSGSPVTGNNLPATINNFTVNNASANPLSLSSSALLISGNMTIGSGVLELGADKQLTVNGTTSLTGADCFVMKSNSTGTASFINNGSISGSGTSKVERYVTNDWNWHLLSSPVAAEPIWNTSSKNFAPVPGAGNSWASQSWNWDFYRWAPQGDPNSYTPYPWVNLRGATGIYNNGSYTSAPYGFGAAIPSFQPGTGYLVAYAPDYGLTTPFFSGNLNYGALSIPLIIGSGTNGNGQAYTNNLNMVGNPYPSALDFDVVSSANPGILTSASYWIMLGDGSYAAYSVGSGGTSGASQYIAPMQGFEVMAASSATFSLTNSMRKHASQTWLKNDEVFSNRVLIAVHNDANNFSDEVIVHFDPGFSAGGGARKFFSFTPEAPNLYTLKDGEKFTINQLSAIENGTEIPLCLKAGVAAQYTLEASGIEGFDGNMPVHLIDRADGSATDLRKDATYTFLASPGDNADRFVLRFGLLTDVPVIVGRELFRIFTHDRNISIENYSGAPKFLVSIYDLRGGLLFQETSTGSYSSIHSPVAEGLYIVKVTSEKGNASGKVVIR